jgi:isopentenyldiphosphate isomerase
MTEEMLDAYDENLKKIGVMSRGAVHTLGAWHRTFHCWIVSGAEGGKVLFQKRGPQKVLFPNFLDITAAGHLESGERPEDGVREVLEELGVKVDYSDLVYLGIKFDIAKQNNITNREFCDVYLLRKDTPPENYQPNVDEVEGLVEMSISDGLALFSSEITEAKVSGIEWNKETKKWERIQMNIQMDKAIPRIDSYYLKVFMMARKLLNGERPLTI